MSTCGRGLGDRIHPTTGTPATTHGLVGLPVLRMVRPTPKRASVLRRLSVLHPSPEAGQSHLL